MIDANNPIELRGAGRLWGTLEIINGRLVLEGKKNDRCVRFDILETVRHRRATVDLVRVNGRKSEELELFID